MKKLFPDCPPWFYPVIVICVLAGLVRLEFEKALDKLAGVK